MPTIRLLICLLALVCAPAFARGETAVDHLKPVISRADFMALLVETGLDYDTRQVAESLYTDYAMGLESLIEETDQAAIEAGRDLVDRAHSGRVRLELDRLRELRADVLRAYATGWDRLDELNDDLFRNLEFFLSGRQLEIAAMQEREIRRRTMQSHLRSIELSYEYAGDGVDVVALVAEARREGHELADLDVPEIDAYLERYVVDFERLRAAIQSPMRQARLDVRVAHILRDNDARERATIAFLEHWSKLYELNHRTMTLIEEALRDHGEPEAASRWRDRMRMANMPWLYDHGKPGRQFDWLMRNPLDDALRADITRLFNEYLAERNAVLDDIVERMLTARANDGVMLHPMVDLNSLDGRNIRDQYHALIRRTGDVSALERGFTDALNRLLDDDLRQQLRRVVR